MENDLEIVGTCGRGDEVFALVQATHADVCLLDIEMPGIDGITVAAELRDQASWCRVLIVTTFGRPGYLRRAMDAGVAGFLVKDTPAEDLARVVREVHAGGRVIDPALAAESLIASQLYLSVGTVRNHVSSAIGKTGAANRTEAAVTARQRGWL